MIKRTLRRITAITLLSTIIVTAVGCGNTNNEDVSKAVANETKQVTIVDDTTGETKEVIAEVIKKDGETYIKTQDSTGKDILVNEKNVENGVVDTSKKEDETTAQKVIEENKKEQESKAEEIATQKETEKTTEKVTEAVTQKPTEKQTEAPTTKPTSHEHNYVATTSTVHHDAVTHTETVQNGMKTVVDKEAWDENTYNTEKLVVCPYCGYTVALSILENQFQAEIDFRNHIYIDGEKDYRGFVYQHIYNEEHAAINNIPGCKMGAEIYPAVAYEVTDRYYPGTYVLSSVHHDAITHQEPNYETKTVVDKAAWDETITVYKCSCGATK